MIVSEISLRPSIHASIYMFILLKSHRLRVQCFLHVHAECVFDEERMCIQMCTDMDVCFSALTERSYTMSWLSLSLQFPFFQISNFVIASMWAYLCKNPPKRWVQSGFHTGIAKFQVIQNLHAHTQHNTASSICRNIPSHWITETFI